MRQFDRLKFVQSNFDRLNGLTWTVNLNLAENSDLVLSLQKSNFEVTSFQKVTTCTL